MLVFLSEIYDFHLKLQYIHEQYAQKSPRRFSHMQREGKFRFYKNNVKTLAQRAATYIQYRYTLGHTFALSEYFCSKLGTESAYRLDYTYKKYSMCKTFMIGAMKPVSLLFDQPT